jgi:hypothetical protein
MGSSRRGDHRHHSAACTAHSKLSTGGCTQCSVLRKLPCTQCTVHLSAWPAGQCTVHSAFGVIQRQCSVPHRKGCEYRVHPFHSKRLRDADSPFSSRDPGAPINEFQILLLGDTYALRLLVPIQERCESRKALKIGRVPRRQTGRRQLTHPSRVGSTRRARCQAGRQSRGDPGKHCC